MQHFIGTYWNDRSATLKDYIHSTKEFFSLLQAAHPAFRNLQWVGNSPNSAVELSSNLDNLDELIFRSAARKDTITGEKTVDGKPTWESTSFTGFTMIYDTGRTALDLDISIKAGVPGKLISNSVVISFTDSTTLGDLESNSSEFFTYSFIKKLFLEINAFWRAERGLVTTHEFSEAVAGGNLPGVGWLTYIRDCRVAALRNEPKFNEIIIEEVPNGGVLFSLGSEAISADNFKQIENARLLRNKLVAEKFISI